MKKLTHIILFFVTLTIISFGCGSKGVNLKAKEKEIQAFFDSTKYLKLKIEVKKSEKINNGIVININGKGNSHDEIYEEAAKMHVCCYIVHKFFRKEVFKSDQFLVFQYSHAQAPSDASHYVFEKTKIDETLRYYDNNPCFAKEMEYLIKEIDPEEYFAFSVCLEASDKELKKIKPSYQKKGLNFFETLYGASHYTCIPLDTSKVYPRLVNIDNIEVIRILLLDQYMRPVKQDSAALVHLREAFKIVDIDNRYDLGELLVAFIIKDSLGILPPDEPHLQMIH